MTLSDTDVLLVEYYEQLSPEERAIWRYESLEPLYTDDYAAVLAELDRIAAGLKARCLS